HADAPPRTGGGGGHGRGGGWAALLLPPHAGEGRDGGGVGREDLRRSGRTLPPPQPSPADGGRGATGVEAAGPPCSFPRMRGKAGMGAVSDARICGAAVGLCPHPNPPPRTGGGGHGRGGGWAALLLP